MPNKNVELRKKYNHDYFQKNKKKIVLNYKKWLSKNIEQQKEYYKNYNKKYYLNNKEKIDLKNVNYAKSHWNEMVKNTRKWQIKNLDKYKKYNQEYDSSLMGFWRRYKFSAKNRKLEMNLTLENFKNIVSQPCHYCGDNEKPRGIDRVDNLIGYTKENSVSCCTPCNMMKKILTKDEFLNQIKKIYEFQKLVN